MPGRITQFLTVWSLISYLCRDKMAGRKLGADLISRNISQHIMDQLGDKPGNWRPLVYCWRGGQRSRSLAIILRQIGYEAHVLTVLETSDSTD